MNLDQSMSMRAFVFNVCNVEGCGSRSVIHVCVGVRGRYYRVVVVWIYVSALCVHLC